MLQVYGLPCGITKYFQSRIGDPLRAKVRSTTGPVLPKWRAAKRSVSQAVTCCGFIGPVHAEKDLGVTTHAAYRLLSWPPCSSVPAHDLVLAKHMEGEGHMHQVSVFRDADIQASLCRYILTPTCLND